MLEIQYPDSLEDICFSAKDHSVSLEVKPKPAEVTGNLSSALISMLIDQYFLKHTRRNQPSLLRGTQASIILLYAASFFLNKLF